MIEISQSILQPLHILTPKNNPQTPIASPFPRLSFRGIIVYIKQMSVPVPIRISSYACIPSIDSYLPQHSIHTRRCCSQDEDVHFYITLSRFSCTCPDHSRPTTLIPTQPTFFISYSFHLTQWCVARRDFIYLFIELLFFFFFLPSFFFWLGVRRFCFLLDGIIQYIKRRLHDKEPRDTIHSEECWWRASDDSPRVNTLDDQGIKDRARARHVGNDAKLTSNRRYLRQVIRGLVESQPPRFGQMRISWGTLVKLVPLKKPQEREAKKETVRDRNCAVKYRRCRGSTYQPSEGKPKRRCGTCCGNWLTIEWNEEVFKRHRKRAFHRSFFQGASSWSLTKRGLGRSGRMMSMRSKLGKNATSTVQTRERNTESRDAKVSSEPPRGRLNWAVVRADVSVLIPL
ncbi:hypothetical protein VP01_4792g2 [Puccinia sorghi]|uniref:Uncharacterized protein n=1 Tax=Puccinia sorghi TaxID=27349 RepID=A0A0L6UMN2_9BASI|nr:hypothetical protein VP01_4792g2 [Puccinia sorghi]